MRLELATEDYSRLWLKLRTLTLNRTLTFGFRSWGVNMGPNRLPFLDLFRWSIESGHAAPLEFLLESLHDDEAVCYLQNEDMNKACLI